MSCSSSRTTILLAIDQAIEDGAGKTASAKKIGLSPRTIRRWRKNPASGDQRPEASRPPSPIALSGDERGEILRVCNLPEYADLPPGQIVPKLADQGIYLGSESSFYRVLKAHKQAAHRGKARAPTPKSSPKRYSATTPNQVWVWDVTWLPAKVTGRFYKLYMVMDLYSRFIITAEVWEEENAAHSITVIERAALSQGLAVGAAPILHGDNGPPLKAATVQAKMIDLGITPSNSRPRVSNDNAHAEAVFRTLKYSPSIPETFASLRDARAWALQFVRWYNHEHLHSSIGFVTPDSKHKGLDINILEKRSKLYEKHRLANPARWIQNDSRDWSPVSVTFLNPPDVRNVEKDLKKSA